MLGFSPSQFRVAITEEVMGIIINLVTKGLSLQVTHDRIKQEFECKSLNCQID